MEEMANLVSQIGLSSLIIIYFLYKDYKFNSQIIAVLTEVEKVLVRLETWHAREDKGE